MGHKLAIIMEPTMPNAPTSLMGVNPIYAPNVTLPPNVMALCKNDLDVRLAKLTMFLGGGFHPEDDMAEYVSTLDGVDIGPTFSAEQAEAANADIDLYPGDPCEFALDVEVAAGLIPAWR
jgi:hypothetical protein